MKIKRQKEFTSDVLRAIDYRLDVARRRRKAALYKGILVVILVLTTFTQIRRVTLATSEATTIRAEIELIPQEDGSFLVVNH